MKAIRRIKQKGLTLIEVMVALVVAGLVIGGALALYSQANTQSITNTLTTALTAIRTSVKSFYTSTGDYGSGSLNATLSSAGKFPTSLSINGATVKHPAGGEVVVTGMGPQFSIRLASVPKEVCVNLATTISGFSTVTIGNGGHSGAPPVDAATAMTQCSQLGSSIDMVFVGS